MKHPFAAAFFEAFLLCVHSFLHLPGILIEQCLLLLASLPFVGILPRLVSFLGKLVSFCCRMDNRSSPTPGESQVSLDLQEWNSLTSSAKSAFLSDHEANNSIVQVAICMLQSACKCNSSLDNSASYSEMFDCLSCCTHFNACLSHPASRSSDISVSLLSNESPEQADSSIRHNLRVILEGTRAQLRSMQSPLQRDTNGFDSWSHLVTSLNPCNRSSESAPTETLVDSTCVEIQRRSLHKRICRINKWQLLLRLHHMPWLRSLRRHALVHPPSQPHLAWRSSNIILSNSNLQAAAAAVSFKVHSNQDPGCPSGDDDGAFSKGLDQFHGMIEQHSRMLVYLKSESAGPMATQQERFVGCGWCCTCESCRGNRKGGSMGFIKRMYQ